MRAVNYFKKRFEFALKGNGSIKINQNDLYALNQVIEFYNDKYKNTQLEDALLLFYLLQNWKVENKENLTLKETSQGIFKITDSKSLFQRIGRLLAPKNEIVKQITIELRLHQKMNNVPDDKMIELKDVAQLLDEEINNAKNNFNFIKELNGSNIVKIQYPKGLSENQKKLFGLH